MSELKVISKFAGEAFGTDNIRTVYAGEAQDTERRPDRTIILVGPIGAGKSSFIDFLCNYFYGARFDSAFRYKIADEIFDSTTPDKAVTKYVFNATKLTYRPIIIDTPGIGDPHGLKADRELAKLVSDYLSAASKERFHAVCLILPSYMHTINQQIDGDLHLTLSLFPDWMRKNIVPLITYSDFGEYDPNLLKHFGLEDNHRFFLNNEFLFRKISADPNRQSEERQVWSRNERNIIEFLRYIGSLRPQTISRRLPSESEPLNQDFEEERRVRSSRETVTYLLETDEVKQIREEFTEHSGSPKRHSDTHRAATSTVFQIPANKPQPIPIGQRIETRTVLGENRSNIPIGQGAVLKDMNRKETFIENIEETVENLELLRRYIYDPTTRTYRIEYAHEVKVHESRRSSQGGSYSDLRRISPTRGGDASGEIWDINRGMRRNTSAPNLEKDSNKENQTRLDYSPQILKKLLGDAIMNESARGVGQQTTISPVRPQVVRMPFDPNEFERQSRQPQRPTSRNRGIGQEAQFEPAPVSQGSPDRSLDKSKDGIFERNSSSRQSLHNSPIRHGGVRHAIVTKDPNAIGQEIAQPTQRPVIQPLPRTQIGQQIRQAQPQNGQGQIPGQAQRQGPGYGQNFDPNRPGGQIGQVEQDGRFDPNWPGNQGQASKFDPNRPNGQIGQDLQQGRFDPNRPQGPAQSAVQSPDPRYAVPQRPLVISQQTQEQGSGYWVGQRGREIEDTTITRQYPQGGNQNQSANQSGRPGSGIGQPIGEGSYDPNRQSQNQPYPYDSTGQTAGYPLRPGTGRGIAPPASGQGVDPRYQQGLSNAPQQSYDPNRQSGPSPYVRTDVHGVRTDYIGTRDGRWVEKRGYEITRDDLLTPKDVDAGLNDQQRLLNPSSRRGRKPAKKRGPLFNCCFYVVAPLVVIGIVATVIVTLVLLA